MRANHIRVSPANQPTKPTNQPTNQPSAYWPPHGGVDRDLLAPPASVHWWKTEGGLLLSLAYIKSYNPPLPYDILETLMVLCTMYIYLHTVLLLAIHQSSTAMFACFKGKGCIRWLAIALDAFEEEKSELSKHLLLFPWGNELLVELIRIGGHNYAWRGISGRWGFIEHDLDKRQNLCYNCAKERRIYWWHTPSTASL